MPQPRDVTKGSPYLFIDRIGFFCHSTATLWEQIASLTFLQQLLFPQQLAKMDPVAASDGVGDGGFEEEVNLLGAPLNGKSISTNSRSWKRKQSTCEGGYFWSVKHANYSLFSWECLPSYECIQLYLNFRYSNNVIWRGLFRGWEAGRPRHALVGAFVCVTLGPVAHIYLLKQELPTFYIAGIFGQKLITIALSWCTQTDKRMWLSSVLKTSARKSFKFYCKSSTAVETILLLRLFEVTELFVWCLSISLYSPSFFRTWRIDFVAGILKPKGLGENEDNKHVTEDETLEKRKCFLQQDISFYSETYWQNAFERSCPVSTF